MATLLNLDPKQTLADVVRDEPAMREPELLRTYAMRHDSGLHVLAAPAGPEAAATVSPAHVTQILRTLLDSYDMVVIDGGSTLDERAMAIFEASEASSCRSPRRSPRSRRCTPCSSTWASRGPSA